MPTIQTLSTTDSQEVFMIEMIGNDGLVHHLGPFKTRAAAEAWMAQNAPPQDDAQAGDRKSGLSTV